MCDVIDDLQTLLPAVKEVHLFSDIDACNKCTETLITLKNNVGEKLKSYNFSEAQDGNRLDNWLKLLFHYFEIF